MSMSKPWYAKPCGNWIPKRVIVVPAHYCDGQIFIHDDDSWGCQTCLKTVKRAPRYKRKATHD